MKKYRLSQLSGGQILELLKRPSIDFSSVIPATKGILLDVKQKGDLAVKKYTKKFDGIDFENIEVSPTDVIDACKRIPSGLKDAFQVAAKNIKKFHLSQFPKKKKSIETMPGVKCFSEFRPVDKVGIYIPGGTAILPSTILMLAIPAKIAGVNDLIMCTPPNKEGKIYDVLLYAAKLAGVTRIFKVGGAQAIAAMAYGTKSIPKVYKICGPGNQYVTAAKMIVSIEPDGAFIDLPAGPSEVLVIADESARADFVAADLLSQAEHGTDSQVVLVSTNEKIIDEVLNEVSRQVALLPRENIANETLKNSFALVVNGIEEGIDFANNYAPEHLILNFKNANSYVSLVQNAGSVFIGPFSCESAGDYASGPNHTLPTYGYAKKCGGVSVETFGKWITFQELSTKGVMAIGNTVERLAECEGLDAHKNAMTIRLKSLN